jgi:hypothetical protein
MDREYTTDDRDYEHKATMIMFAGGNGDYYQQINWTDHRGLIQQSPAIRYCTSGGCSTRNPALLSAVVDQYRALGEERTMKQYREDKIDKAYEMLQRILDNEVPRDAVETFVLLKDC